MPRVTSDAKHVEIGLTDKADSARWLFGELARNGTGAGLVLVAGDEFGTLGGLPGSDSLLLVPEAARATAVSVGAEPTGVPAGVIALDGGPERFLELLADQLERRRRGDVPELDAEPGWTFEIEGIDPPLERVHESLLTLADGRIGSTRRTAARPSGGRAGRADGRRLHRRGRRDRARARSRLDEACPVGCPRRPRCAGCLTCDEACYVTTARSRRSSSRRSGARARSRCG